MRLSRQALATAVLSPPEAIPPSRPMVMENLAQSGLGNPVAGVLFVYRALDTLLEKVVLILALLGVWSLAPDSVGRSTGRCVSMRNQAAR